MTRSLFERCRSAAGAGRIAVAAGFLLAVTLVPPVAEGQTKAVSDPEPNPGSVVEVLVVYQETDALLPWRKRQPGRRSGYGVVVDGQRVLTTESLVRNHTLVELRASRSGEKIPAVVQLADPQQDLALLSPSRPDGFPTLVPLPIGTDMPTNDGLAFLQFDNTARLRSSQARLIEVSMNNLPNAPYSGLTATLLASENVNGVGAPVLYGGRLAGLILAFNSDDRTAMMVPGVVLSRFLEDAARQPYLGPASAGLFWSPLIDPAKRRYLGVADEVGGILLSSFVPRVMADQVLKPEDVLIEMDGQAIDRLGFYQDASLGRLNFSHLIRGHHRPGDVIPLKVVRHGKVVEVALTLGTWDDRKSFIPDNVTGEQPEFLVDAGMIIREVDGDYLRAFGEDWSRRVNTRIVNLYLTRRYKPEQDGDRLVILSSVLPHPINIGYQSLSGQIVDAVNGQPVRHLNDVFRIVDADGGIERLKLRSIGVDVVIDRSQREAANAELARLYGLRQLRYRKPVL